jgi:DNA polymerase
MSGQIDALSALDWWREAGVDTLVDEEPRDWLRPPPKPQLQPASPAASTASELPATLASLHVWLRESSVLPGAPTARILPAGDPASGLMLLADMPEPADAAEGALFSGEIGRLFDRMLAAIGRDRASIYLAAMAGARVPGRELEAPETTRIARHHVALAAPRALLLLGNAPSRALLGMDFAAARGRKHEINHEGATVTAIATFHPRLLLQQSARKADAWADLRLLLEVLSV